jgi:hypothetical protein
VAPFWQYYPIIYDIFYSVFTVAVSYLDNSSFTIVEMALPSALPDSCLEATPITFPISAGLEAPT